MDDGLVAENALLQTIAESDSSSLSDLEKIKETMDVMLGKSGYAISAPEVKQTVKKLCKEGFLKVKAFQTNSKEDSATFTMWGLFRVLEGLFLQEMTDDSLFSHLDKISVKDGGKQLPFLFSPYLQNREIGAKILRKYFNFRPKYHQAPQQCHIEELASFGFKMMTKAEFESMIVEGLADFIFLIEPENRDQLSEEDMKAWNIALGIDKKTAQYAIERLCIFRGRYVPKVDYANQRIRFFEDSRFTPSPLKAN